MVARSISGTVVEHLSRPSEFLFFPKKRRGALMARIPPVADTDGTDLALPLEVARRSGSICDGEAGAVIPSHISK